MESVPAAIRNDATRGATRAVEMEVPQKDLGPTVKAGAGTNAIFLRTSIREGWKNEKVKKRADSLFGRREWQLMSELGEFDTVILTNSLQGGTRMGRLQLLLQARKPKDQNGR